MGQFPPLDKPFYHDIDELALWLIDTIEIDNALHHDGRERSVAIYHNHSWKMQ